MDLAVGRRPGGVHVGDVEQTGIGPAREARRQRLPDGRMRAVAAGEVGCFADLLRAVRTPEHRPHAVGALLEMDQLRPALDRHSQGRQAFDQQQLVNVLRVGQHVGEGAQSGAQPPER